MKHQVLIKTCASSICLSLLFVCYFWSNYDGRQLAKRLTSLSFDFFFNQRTLCSMGVVNFVFKVSTITSSRGTIMNIKKVKSWGRVKFFCGGSSLKNDCYNGGPCEKAGKLRGVMRFLNDASLISPATSTSSTRLPNLDTEVNLQQKRIETNLAPKRGYVSWENMDLEARRRNAPKREQMRPFCLKYKEIAIRAHWCSLVSRWTGEGGTLQRLCRYP